MTTTFHPLQKYKHLCNRLDSVADRRDKLILAILEQKKKIASLQEAVQHMETDEAASLQKERNILIEEGKVLLPELRGFGKCYDTLKGIVRL